MKMRTLVWSRLIAPRFSKKVPNRPFTTLSSSHPSTRYTQSTPTFQPCLSLPTLSPPTSSTNWFSARLFNSSPIQPRRCRILLTKIALLLYTGEKFPTNEATTLFFGISKLFQNKDASLRQMVHLVIKELANSAEDIIMVTSTIMKDTGGSTDAIYRPNAIRALCRIIDVRPNPRNTNVCLSPMQIR